MDYRIDDIPCKICDSEITHSQDCSNLGCHEGSIDLYDDDPINQTPCTYRVCPVCIGKTIERWCPNCGKDQ